MKTITHFLIFTIFQIANYSGYAQMNINGNIFVGNEWIDNNKTYFKIKVGQDGIYNINPLALQAAGVNINSIRSSQLQLWCNGKEVPLYISEDAPIADTKAIEFYGQKNRLALDTFIYDDWTTKLLNKEFSFITDTATYFITVVPLNANVKRVREISPNYNGTLPAKESFYWHKKKLVFNNTYYAPTFDGDNKFRYSNFFAVEGFSQTSTSASENTIDIDEIYDDANFNATLNIREGLNESFNRQSIKFNGNEIYSKSIASKFSVFDTLFSIATDMLQNSNKLTISNTGINDRHLLASLELMYPRKFKFDNSGFYELRLNNAAQYIELDGITESTFDLYAYSIDRNEILKTGLKNGKRVLLTNNATNHQNIIIYDRNNGIQQINSIEKAEFDFSDLRDINYLIVTSRKLLNQENGQVYLNEYINYRIEKDGPERKIGVVYVEDIYNTFGYGIQNHIYAFKNFNHYLKQNTPTLKFVFIVGKGSEFWDIRGAEIQNKTIDFYIPTYGDYPSDELLFTDLNQNSSGYAIGRLPVKDVDQIRSYLNKVKLFEQEEYEPYGIESQFWKKSILHLSGGANLAQQQLIKGLLGQMEFIISRNFLGSNTSSTAKVTTEPIDGTISDRILKSIRDGVFMITFLGHSSPGSWDISIEDPSKWNNHGKNPIVFSLGCYAGNIHTKNFNVGENFVMTEDLGAVAFVASTGSAELGTQASYGRDIYSYMGEEFYGKTLGEILSKVKDNNKNSSLLRVFTLNQQFTLLGDPALRLFGNEAPDYTPSFPSVKLEPENVGSGDKTFDLIFDTYNLGKNILDSMNVRVIFENVDRNIADTFIYRIPCPNNRSNNRYTIPNKGVNSLGRNRLSVYIDYDQQIAETPASKAENNNELISANGQKGFEFYILDNTAFPVYPGNFAIVNQKPHLRVSTSNAFAHEAKYVVQIDTTEYFNSPSLTTKTIIAKGGTFVVNTDDISISENRVYYWRVSPDSTLADIGYIWYNSSFIYLPSSTEGWNQSHYFQYKKNPEGYMYIDDNRVLKYSPRIRTIEINNGIYVDAFIGYKVDFNNPAASVRPWAFMNGGIAIAVLDTLISTHEPNSGGSYGSINSAHTGSSRCFAYKTNTPEERKKVVDFINDVVKDGYYVSFFTCYNDLSVDINGDEWAADTSIYGNSINKVLKAQGAELVDGLASHPILPYNFMFRKNRGFLAEAIGQGPNDIINTKYEYTYSGTEGNMLTVPLGSASKWHNVIWDTDVLEPLDSVWITVVGVDKNFNETTLIPKNVNRNIDISNIDAKSYPNLKLNFHSKDLVKRTVPQLKYLRILADLLPDGSINQSLAFNIPDSVQQGEPLTFEIGVENFSKVNMDSLLIKYTYIAPDNTQYNNEERIAPLLDQQQIIYKSTLNTRNLLGNYSFNFEINPNEDQPESVKYNNLGIKNFKVYPDRINPLLNVTFDGLQILDNDLVSPTPLIRIEVKDENKFLLLDDPGSVEIIVEFPDLTKKTYTINDSGFKFTRAGNGNDNKAIIELTPTFEDGDYFITIQSKDISGNFSGINKYEVKFRVINKKAVTNVLNYPNPFSTATKFVFTVTGEVPENVRIQIMTVSGKVVKEITEAELGPLKIGTNITNYSWNGTDEYGSKLANGVYLYKVSFSNAEGKKYESIEENDIDHLFHKGFGKLVIMR